MDRIQKALDKAKAKQQANVGIPQDTKKQEKVSVVKEVPGKLTGISYTQTKIIKISEETLASKHVIASQYSDPQSGVFRMLRTQVLQKMRENNWQTVAITSPTAGEGKSLVASNLALAMAMESNQTVLLVDLDLRNPRINDYYSLGADVGLKDYLEGDIELTDVLINPGIQGLVILPGKDRAEDSAELLSSKKMMSLASDLKAKYDSRMIIFDMPPILQTDDVLLASKYIDSILLVVEDGKNKEAELVKAVQLLDSNKLIGSVLNKSEKPPIHQSY